MNLEIVSWEDSVSHHGWEEISDIELGEGDMECRSVGWVVKESENAIVLASTIGHDDSDCNNRILIPKSMITRRRVLAEHRHTAGPGGP